MKNSIKLFLLSLLTPLLCGVSFALDFTADEVAYLENNALNKGSFVNKGNYLLYDKGSNSSLYFCVVFSGLSSSDGQGGAIFSTTNVNAGQAYGNFPIGSSPYFIFCNYSDLRYIKIAHDPSNNNSFSANRFWVVDSSKIVNGYLGFDVQGLLNNYNQCSADLNICDTSVQQCLIDKESLSGSLASCNADKNSLQIYNESLSFQLNECLSSGSGSISGSGFLISSFSLFWSDNGDDYSLPITNNLFLPNGYKAMLNSDNVLSIARANSLSFAYSIDDSDFSDSVVGSYSVVYLFLVSSGLFLFFIYIIRRYFIGLKSVK